MMYCNTKNVTLQLVSVGETQIWSSKIDPFLKIKYLNYGVPSVQKVGSFVASAGKVRKITAVSDTGFNGDISRIKSYERKSGMVVKKKGTKEHHFWQKRDSAMSGQKALNLVRIISGLPNEKEAVYGALDKWIAWETEFPLIAAAKALRILRKRSQWTRVIQVAKWMLSKGQGATMATYDSLLLAFDKDSRPDEAEMLWDMILHTHTRSTSKMLFSRMISLYDHHNMPEKIIEIFADMEELEVRPDEDTLTKIARAFDELGQAEKKKLALNKYRGNWKYIHFNGERIRVRRDRLK